MPTYLLRCLTCGAEIRHVCGFGEEKPTNHRVDLDGGKPCGPLAQVFTPPAIVRSTPDHFNHSLGQYVRNDADARSKLSEASDRMSERMGFDHRYEFVDGNETKELGVTDEGLDATRARERAEGKTEGQFYG